MFRLEWLCEYKVGFQDEKKKKFLNVFNQAIVEYIIAFRHLKTEAFAAALTARPRD